MENLFCWIEHHQGLAAWVQAFGSIAAVIGAYVVGERQSRAALRTVFASQKIAEASRRAGTAAVVRAARDRARLIEDALDEGDPVLAVHGVYHPSIIETMLSLMKEVPVHEFGSDEAVDSFVIFSGQFAFLRTALDKFLAGPYKDVELLREIEDLRRDGYEERFETELIVAKRSALKRNVHVHLRQIDVEFSRLRAALEAA